MSDPINHRTPDIELNASASGDVVGIVQALVENMLRSDGRVYISVLLMLTYIGAVLTGPIMNGHDTYISFSHVEIWASALRAGDLFSVWTPVDANGFGSPVPFFYHKLFNLVAAFLTLSTGDIVTGVRAGILLFSFVMFAGMDRCAAYLGADRRSRLVIGTICTLSPYTLVCIFERGALAEYSAMALVPFGIAQVIALFTARNRPRPVLMLSIVLMLLALAHVTIFVAAVGLLALFGLFAIKRAPVAGIVLLGLSGVATSLFVGLVYMPFAFWSSYFSPSQARLHGLPADNTVALIRIFSPNPGSWFGWPVLALTIALAWQFRRRTGRLASMVWIPGSIAVILLLCMTRLAAPLWRTSDLLDFVQFPWRFLSLTTPLIFIVLAASIEQLAPTQRRYVQLGLLVMTLLNTGGMLASWHRVFSMIPVAELRHQVSSTGPGPDAGGEYFPARYSAQLAATPDLLARGAASILPSRRPLIEAGGGCTSADILQMAYIASLHFEAHCASVGSIRVNQFDTPFLDVTAKRNDGLTIHPFADGVFFDLPLSTGNWTIHVRQRTYLELVRMVWGARFSHFRP
ncbi:hypothetical protein [Paraburkholderia sp.]|uniref:hypothetical protein n=1 Tax=Paraburkholderia sp. TaxID=1926495 RepID=UPI003D6EC1A1